MNYGGIEMKKWVSIAAIAILQAVAIIGAIPLISRTSTIWVRPNPLSYFQEEGGHYSTFTRHIAVWDNIGALIGFFIIAIMVMVFLSRHESRQTRVLMSLGVPALLFGTIRLIQHFA